MGKQVKSMKAPCMGCRYSEITSGTKFECKRPGQTQEAVMSALIDAFLDGNMSCYEWPEGCPSDFPKGFKQKNGKYYKTDKAGNVIEIRNIFGNDITAYTTIDKVFG